MMVARTWVAVILSCFIWFAYLKWFAPPPPPAKQSESQQQSLHQGSQAAPNEAVAVSGTGGFPMAQLPVASSHTISNEKVSLSFSNLGGKPSETVLLQYKQTIRKDSPNIALINPQNASLALGAFFSDPDLKAFSSGEYQSVAQGNKVEFTRHANGYEVTKTYELSGNSYFLSNTIKVRAPGQSKQSLGYLNVPVGQDSLTYDRNDPEKAWELVYLQNDSVQRAVAEKISAGETVKQGLTSWIAFGNRYFSTAIVNQSTTNPDVVLAKQSGFVGGYLRFPVIVAKGASEAQFKFQIYVGPKDFNALSQVPRLHELIDYGFFSVFAYPLLRLLQFFYRFVHNYGIAIILLTILVRLIFYPLSAKGARSMKSMQKLQPQIQALKAKYKDDMQRFNQEQMALFKAHKVNPLGGCFPMLVQIPVFIALYSVLANSIELFHAPFFAWVQDLSAKDPLYIFPVLMGVSMFIQQRMTPMAGMDPVQQKMMYFMPVIFTFMMINLPSGLTAYIFLSTVLGIVQQWVINKEMPKTAAAHA